MGFFKSVRDLQKQAKDIEKNTDFSAMRADGMAKMAAAQEMLGRQTRAANDAASGHGTWASATAQVTSMRQVGALGFDPLMEFELTVLPDGRPPYPAHIQQSITQMQMVNLRAGASVPAKIDPANPSGVWLDLGAAG